MKRSCSLFVVMLLPVLAGSVWAQPAAPVETQPAAAAGAVSLAVRLAAGTTYDTSVTTNVRRLIQSSGEDALPTYSRTSFVTRSRVLEADAEGVMTVENEFRALKLRQESGNTLLFDYDSTRPPATGTAADPVTARLARIYAPLIASRYRARVAPDGRVLEVLGVREMIDGILVALRTEGVTEAELTQTRADFERSFSGDRLREHFFSVTELPPLTPVQIGEPWTRQFLSGDPDLPMVVRSTGRVSKQENNEITIHEAGDLVLDREATKMDQSPIPVSVRFMGSHRGGTVLNLSRLRRTSWLLQQYNATFTFTAPASPGTPSRRAEINLQGRTDYLIEVVPATEG